MRLIDPEVAKMAIAQRVIATDEVIQLVCCVLDDVTHINADEKICAYWVDYCGKADPSSPYWVYGKGYYQCSRCKAIIFRPEEDKHCRNCGAYMYLNSTDGKGENNEAD